MGLADMAFGAVSKAGFANRDQNSSIGATVVRRGVPGTHKTATMQARSGHFAGKTRGVGRKEGRDQNSSPNVSHVQPRHPNGRFVSHENDLKVVHPQRNTGARRTDRTSAVGHWTKGQTKLSKPWVSKVDVPLENLMRGLSPKKPTSAFRGLQQSKRVKPAYRKLDNDYGIDRTVQPGANAHDAASDLAATVKGSRASKLYGRSNTRFGLMGSRGRRLS